MISTVELDAVREREGDLLRLPRRRADERRLDLGSEATSAQLDHGVRLSLAIGVDEIDDERVTRLGRPLARRSELRDRLAERLDLGIDGLLRNLDLRARHLELRPVDELGERLHLDGRDEAPGLVGGSGKLELVLRVGDGPHATSRCGVPEPPADVAVDGLRVDAFLAEPRHENLRRDLPLAEAGDLHALGQIRHRVLDRMASPGRARRRP